MQAANSFTPSIPRILCAVAVTAIIFTFVPRSHADVTTYDVEFTANTLVTGSGPDPAPVDPVIGSFQVTFDPTLTYVDNTIDISLNSLNIALGSALSFSYDPDTDAFGGGTLIVGGTASGPGFITYDPSTNDFWLFITNFATAPAFEQLGYTQTAVSNDNLFYTLNQTGTVNVTTAIPEPSSMVLASVLASAFCFMRRRKTTA